MQSAIIALLFVASAFAQYNYQSTNQQYPTNNQYQTTTRSTYQNQQQYPYNTNTNTNANTNQQYSNQYSTQQYGSNQYGQYTATTPSYNSQTAYYGSSGTGVQRDQQFFNSVSKASTVLSIVGVAAYALL